MSDFLTRLAERQLGHIPLIQPRMPSMFASLASDAGIEISHVLDEREPTISQKQASSEASPHHLEPTDIKDTSMSHVSLPPVTTQKRWPTASQEPLVPQIREEHAENPVRFDFTPVIPENLRKPNVPKVTPVTPKKLEQVDVSTSPLGPTMEHFKEPPTSLKVHKEVIREKVTIPVDRPVEILRRALPESPPQLVSLKTQTPPVPPQRLEKAQYPGNASRSASDQFRQQAPLSDEPPVQVTIGRIEVTAMTEAPPKKRAKASRQPSVTLSDYLAQQGRGRK